MIDPKQYEREFNPMGGDLGRACLYPYTSGMKPEDVDLRGYSPFSIGGQTEFPIYGASGAPFNIRWRAWVRSAGQRHYCIVFEDYI